jgi:hypothetical protein
MNFVAGAHVDGALGGAPLLVFGLTLRSARGDLCRIMGMRLVAVVEELFDISADLKVVQKSGFVWIASKA